MQMGGCIAIASKLKHFLLECRGRLTGLRSQQNLQDSGNSWNLPDSGSLWNLQKAHGICKIQKVYGTYKTQEAHRTYRTQETHGTYRTRWWGLGGGGAGDFPGSGNSESHRIQKGPLNVLEATRNLEIAKNKQLFP